jgi:UDP-N-acetylglucosamine 3-dehydrogenase
VSVPVAVVGVGNMGRHHARNYRDLCKDADLRAVVDADVNRAEEIAGPSGARAFTSIEAMLEAVPEVEAVSVAVPTSAHHEVARTLLSADKHVLVEKPIAPTVEEIDDLIGLAKERSRVLAVGHVERFNPAVRQLRRLIDDGKVGEPLSLVARRVGVMPPQVKDANVIVDLAVHDIDIFGYLLDDAEPTDLFCNAGRALAEDRFDFADIFLRYGTVACFLQVNWLTPVKIRSLSVTGTAGYADVEYVTQRLDYYRGGAAVEPKSFAELAALSSQQPERLEFPHEEPLARELLEFLRSVRGEPAETLYAEQARETMVVAAKLVALAESHELARSG